MKRFGKIATGVAIASATIGGAVFIFSADPYGNEGWQDADDYSAMIATNNNGDTLSLNTAQTEFFGRTMTLSTASIKFAEGSFDTSCEASQIGKNNQGLDIHLTSLDFVFPENEASNESIEEVRIIHGTNKETGEKLGMAILVNQGLLFLQEQMVAKLGRYSKVDIVFTDKCNNEFVTKFNTTGDVAQLASGLQERQRKEINALAEKEFE